MEAKLYTTADWDAARARVLERDDGRCTVSRLLGGPCHPEIHVHHIETPEDRPDLAYTDENLASVCKRHHPVWESIRRGIVLARERADAAPPRCPHRHTSLEARRLCERRLARKRGHVQLSLV